MSYLPFCLYFCMQQWKCLSLRPNRIMHWWNHCLFIPSLRNPLSVSMQQAVLPTTPALSEPAPVLAWGGLWSQRQPSSEPGSVLHSKAADHQTESWQASKPWLSFSAPNCCHRCPDFIAEMSLMAAGTAGSGKQEPDIGSSAGHWYSEKGSKRKEKSCLQRLQPLVEQLKSLNTFLVLLPSLENCNRCYKTVSGGSLCPEL